MTRLLIVLVVALLLADAVTLVALSPRHAAVQPDLEPRVRQLETDLAQAQQDLGELKQEMQILQRRGQPQD